MSYFKTQAQLDKYVKDRKFPEKSIYYGKTLNMANAISVIPELRDIENKIINIDSQLKSSQNDILTKSLNTQLDILRYKQLEIYFKKEFKYSNNSHWKNFLSTLSMKKRLPFTEGDKITDELSISITECIEEKIKLFNNLNGLYINNFKVIHFNKEALDKITNNINSPKNKELIDELFKDKTDEEKITLLDYLSKNKMLLNEELFLHTLKYNPQDKNSQAKIDTICKELENDKLKEIQRIIKKKTDEINKLKEENKENEAKTFEMYLKNDIVNVHREYEVAEYIISKYGEHLKEKPIITKGYDDEKDCIVSFNFSLKSGVSFNIEVKNERNKTGNASFELAKGRNKLDKNKIIKNKDTIKNIIVKTKKGSYVGKDLELLTKKSEIYYPQGEHRFLNKETKEFIQKECIIKSDRKNNRYINETSSILHTTSHYYVNLSTDTQGNSLFQMTDTKTILTEILKNEDYRHNSNTENKFANKGEATVISCISQKKLNELGAKTILHKPEDEIYSKYYK